MANNKQGKCAKGCRCVKHDDTCSSDEIPNSKATQLSPEKSESMAAPAGNSSDDKSVTPDEITSALDKISDAHNRNFALFSLDKDGAIGKRDIKYGDPRRIDLLLGAAFPSSTISPSSVRHKYVVESTITRSPINFRSPLSTNLDDFSQRTSNPASFNRHSLPITDGFDTILSEINNRCKNSDSINQDMQSKLHTKNQQLSEQKALLEKSNENVRKLEQQFKDEKREKTEVKKRLMELMDERKQMEESRKEIDAALNSLRQEIQEADQSLRERASTINSLNIELDEMRRSSDTARKESQSSITQIQHDHNAMFGKLAEMHKLVNEKEADIKRMKKLYGDEAHMRKAAESEIRLVTEQGQSLMEHQKVIRLQYQDDISAHQQKVDTLSKLIGELELQNKHLVEQLTTKEEVARESLASMAEKLEQTKEVHEQQRVKDQSEIANLGRQLEAKIIVENMLQGTITGLKEEHMNTEQRLIAAQERLKIENSNLKTEIEKLKNLREEEVRDHKTKLHDAGRINKEALELQMAKIERQKKDVDKENINLKCRIAEMEERLDDRETAVTSLKDAINELSESERQATTEYNELQLEHSQTKEQKAKILKEKEKEIDILRKSIGKFEKDSVRNLTETNEEIGSLRTKLERLTGENVELNRELASKSQELTALKSAHDEARNSADQITSMRALLSKKESSKAILLAEQQKMEREYSTALSQKTSEVNTLEQEIRALHQENASLKSKRGSAETDMGHRPQEQSVMTTNSLTSIKQQQNTGDDALTRSMLARRESSNQILAAENKKVKDELKNANTWWQRDVNELQRRHANQTSALSHMERKMTSLEMENNQLKRQSIDTCEQNKARTSSQASNNSAKEPQSSNAAYENLLDHYKRELTIKESKIKNLEASLRSAKGDTHSAIQKLESASEQEYAMKIALESKLSQNELDAEKLQSSLMEAEGFLEQKDVKATQNLLRHSNAELKILLANIKQANRSASGTLEVAAEKQTCLIKLHQRFSQSLIQIQKDAACATTQQKSEIEALNKHYEAQLSQLNDTLQSLLGDLKEKSQELTTLTGKKLELETTNKKLEERLREVKIHASNAHHDLEITRAAKQAAVTQVEELTVTVEHLQQSKGQLETKLQLAKTECAIAKDREAVEVKSKYEAKLAKMSENHQREIRDIASKMKMSEKRNSNLYVEINKLQTKVGSESKDLEMEVQDLHGQVQKLALEKSDLQERFREGLTTLKDDNDLTLRERSNHIHRLQCNNAELEAKVETLQDELRTRKEAGTKQIDELKRCKAERLDDIHKFEEKLAKSNGEVKILKDSLDIEKRQLSQTLESLTNIEVEYVKLHSHMKQTDGTSKQSESKLIGIIDKLKAENGHKSSKYKELYNENKHLRSVIKAHEGEIKMTDEKMGILKRDAQHADSVAQLYKKQFEALRKESECRMSPNRSVQSHQNMGFPKPMSVTNVYPPARIAESVDGLGAKVAELTNQITQLQNANSLLKKQNELTEIRLKDQLENGGYHHDMVKALGKQRDEYQTMVEKMTSQLENLQHQLKHQRADNDSLRTSFDMNSERLEKVTKELNVATKERESMEHKLSETSMLKTIADAKAVNEAELQRYSEELKRKLYSERESAYKIEQGLRDNSIQLQRELNTLRQNMEDAHHANKSLEAYIRNMRKSYSQVFHDAPEPQNFQSINRGSSGFMESLMYPERRMSSASKSRTKTAAPSFSYV